MMVASYPGSQLIKCVGEEESLVSTAFLGLRFSPNSLASRTDGWHHILSSQHKVCIFLMAMASIRFSLRFSSAGAGSRNGEEEEEESLVSTASGCGCITTHEDKIWHHMTHSRWHLLIYTSIFSIPAPGLLIAKCLLSLPFGSKHSLC